jgi:PRTRC genetic system protein B
MKDITEIFSDVYLPHKALIFYQNPANDSKLFVEAYDIDEQGRPVNAHPLSMNEMKELSNSLQTTNELRTDYLISAGVLPDNVLHLRQGHSGYAIWHTPAKRVKLYFHKDFPVETGEANVPALVWKANRHRLQLYALKTTEKLTAKTLLYHPPFFNIRLDESVCMGTVQIDVENVSCLEDFMTRWEAHFWNSYFTHTIGNESPVKGNIIQLWQNLIGSEKPFPLDVLKKNGKTIKDLII